MMRKAEPDCEKRKIHEIGIYGDPEISHGNNRYSANTGVHAVDGKWTESSLGERTENSTGL